MKKIIVLMLLFLTILTGCSYTYENGVPTYFLEPEGYIIAKVEVSDSNFVVKRYKYGYILEEDYQSYLEGKMDGILVVKHPYENGKEVTTPFREIIGIEVGIYEDKRF